MIRLAFITVGDPQRLTGGYLYHQRVFAQLPSHGVQVEQIVASPADRQSQAQHAHTLGGHIRPENYDLVMVDALARVVTAPWLDQWRTVRPLVAMVHELPSVANLTSIDHDDEAPLLRAHRLICVSRHGQQILMDRGVPAERITIVSPGRDRVITSEQQPASTTPLTVLCVAQWIERKGILDLVRAWGYRPRNGAVLQLIGETHADPAYTQHVLEALAELPPDRPVSLLGAVDDQHLMTAYRQAALFALPSRYEGYGMAFAEALSHGLPVIACPAGPVPELLGAAGLIVPVGDLAALDSALTNLLSDQHRRVAMAEAARHQATTLPTWDDTTRAFAAVCHTVVHESTHH